MTTPDDLEAQMETALDALRMAVVRLLRDSEVTSQLALLALVRVTGEVGATAAWAIRVAPAPLLADLAEAMRYAGARFHERLEAGAMPPAGHG